MNGLRDAEPEAARHMFVFPLALMNGMADDFAKDHENARDGDVILFSRPPATADESPASAVAHSLVL